MKESKKTDNKIPSGIILYNKSAGVTSFGALSEIKRALGTGKVGHTGTLDKFAQGLLIVLAGNALKLSGWFTHLDKQYLGKIHFGIETDTLDPEGNEIAAAPIPSREKVEEAFLSFTGTIMQEPPAYSAIHVNGKRASDLARSGKPPQMKKREVTIYKLELRNWQPPYAEIFVHCSSGTYIRSLARDIALAAGSRAHLASLLRTQVGKFGIGDRGEERFFLRPVDKTVVSDLGLPWFDVSLDEAQNIFHGKPLFEILEGKTLFGNTDVISNNNAAVFSGEELVAIVNKTDNVWKYCCVLS